jgi:nicotinamidase-related amidase
MKWIGLLVSAIVLAGYAGWSAETGGRHLALRSRVAPFRGSGEWSEVRVDYEFEPAKSAIIVCDMWDQHWCRGANRRVAELARRLEPVLENARAKGITIVHAPSDTMGFYAQMPQRQRILSLPSLGPPKEIEISAPPLPIDDSGGGCDTAGDREHRVWTSEQAILKIAPEDYISDNGREIYNLLRSRGIRTVFYTGVHTNMCILNRTFAIKQMTRWGMHCILLRDLTDAMYGPQDAHHVSHQAGTELVIEYIEKYWSPTALSGDLSEALASVRN